MKRLLSFFAMVFVISILHAQTKVFTENFDPPSNADSVTATGTAGTFALNSRLHHSGTQCDSAMVTPNGTAYLTTNSFSTLGYGYVILKFSHICKIELYDYGTIEVSVNNGAWVQLTGAEYINDGSSQFGAPNSYFSSSTYPGLTAWAAGSPSLKPTQTWWRNETFDISTIAHNSSNVRVRFKLVDGNSTGAGFARGWYIDDINVTAAISELNPPILALAPPIVQDTIFNTGPFDIYAWIKDASGIDTAYIAYQVNGGSNLYVPMHWVSDSTYKGTIPSYTYNTNITYTVYAVDSSASHNTAHTTSTWFITKKPPSLVQIGAGTSVGNWPFNEGYGYTRSASIYLGSEINMGGVINALQWQVASTEPTNCPVKIYLKSTISSAFTAGSSWSSLIAGATLVYDGPTNFSTSGWKSFVLTAPFNYSSGNLMVLCETNYGSFGLNPFANFNYTSTTGNTHQYFTQNTTPPTGNGSYDNSRPNIKISFPATNYHADAGVSQILTPTGTIIAGVNSPITLYIKNFGIDTLRKATVRWKLDGVVQASSYPWVGLLADGIVSGIVNVGNVNVGIGSHTLKVWTEIPNDSIDHNHYNDTASISFYACTSLLNGSYTIGGAGANFPTFADAMTALNNCGVGGPTVFLINNGTYNLNLTFNAINGVSATNTVTFKPNAGATVTFTSAALSTLSFNDSHYVIFDGSNNSTNSRNMSIINTNSAGSAVIWIVSSGSSNGCKNITIKNCDITGASVTSGYGVLIGGITIPSGGDDNDNITIQNNSISKASIGIWARGNATTNPGIMDSLYIIGNSIGSNSSLNYIGHDGMILGNGTDCKIDKNTVFNILTSDPTPVGITLSDGFVSSTILKNNLNNIKYTGSSGYGGRGLYVNTGSSSSKLIIANNIIYQISGDGYGSFSNSSPVGMYFDGTNGGLNIYYNSVYMSGNLTYTSATKTAAILFNSFSITDIALKNNVFQNSMNNITSSSSVSYAIYSDAPASSFTSINNNVYYAPGTQGMLGYMSSDIATIAAWRTATGQDLNSLSADPVFLGVSDLHSFSSVLNAHGVPVSSVTDDFNGTIRNATTPDIGAYEFEIAAKNLGILAIIQPSSSCALTANEHIAIRLKNFGSAQIDTAQVYYKINNGTVVHEQMIHPILPDSVYVYTFAAAADFSVPGHYVVKSYIHVVHDTNFINDTINNYNIDAGVNLNYGPYTMGFEPTDDMSLWTKLDVNADGSTWVFPVTYNMHNGANAAQVNTSFNTGNDWLFSRCFKFTSGNTYKIEFWYRADYAGSPQNLDLKMGTDNNPTAMTTNLITLASFDSTVYQKASATFVPTTTGTYYFGWWGHSSSMYSSAYIDDINISLIPPQEASMSKIVTPNSGCGLTATEPISIIIKNTGLNVINANLITAHYKINNAATVNQLVSTAINANDSLLFVFTQTANLHVTTRDSLFSIKSWVTLAADPFQFNDSTTKSVNSLHTPVAPVAASVTVPYGTQATLHAIDADSIKWYEFATGGTALASSSSFTTPNLYNTTVYYAESYTTQPIQYLIDGTGTLTQSNIPVYGDAPYGWSGTIYDAAELGFSGTIDTLYYYVSNSINSFNIANQSIYMLNTTSSKFTNANKPATSGMTQVFSGSISWTGPGWQKIVLQTPFVYDNSKNLMIYYENNSGASAFPYPYFAATTMAVDKGVYAYDWTSLPSSGYTTTLRANIMLSYIANGCTSARVADTAFVTGTPPCDMSVQVIHTPNSGILLTNSETVSVRVKNYGTSPAVAVPIHYSVNGNAPVNEIIPGTIPSNDTVLYNFTAPVDLSALGIYELVVYTDLACDGTKANDTIHKTITCSPLVYCTTGANNTGDEEIYSVTLNGATNAYDCSTVAPGPGSILNRYSNFTTLAPLTDLKMGIPIHFTIEENECDGSPYYQNGIAIWVDLNRNGDYNDPGEEVFVENTTTISPRTVTGTIVIPPGSFVGLTTMRVTCAESYSGPSLTPCLSYGYGETEDYSVRILPPIPHDAAVVGFAQPSPIQDEGALAPVKVIVRNLGLDTIKNSSNMTVSYSYNSGTAQTVTWTGGNIPPLAFDTITIPGFTVLFGNHSLCGWTILAGDSNTYNDTTCINIHGKPQLDAGVTAILKPGANSIQGTNQIVKVSFKNFGADTITSMNLVYKVNGVFQASQLWTGTLLPSATDSVAFTQTFVVPMATYSVCAYTELLNDEDNSNDTTCSSSYGLFTSTLPFYDNFDGTIVNWTQTNDGHGSIWQLGTPFYGATNSAFSQPNAWDINLDTPYTNSAEATLYTQYFDFSNATNARIHFMLNYNLENTYDGLRLDYTTDNGTTWQTLGVMNDPLGTNWYNYASLSPTSLPAWTGNSNGWIKCEYKMSILNSLPKVRFRFVFNSDGSGIYDGVSIDNFSITIPSHLDAGVELIQQPITQAPAASQKIVKVSIHNYGLDTLHTIPVSFVKNSGAPTTETWHGNLAPDASVVYQFTALLTVPSGAFLLRSYTGLPVDGDHLNDTVATNIMGVATFHAPYSNNMEGTVYFFTTGNLWEWGVPASATINSAYSPTHAWKTNLNGTYPNNANEDLYSPLFNFSGLDSAYLDFYHWYDTQAGSDGGNVQYTVNGGTSWITLGIQNDPEGLNWYNDYSGGSPCWSGSSGGYVHSRYRLTSVPGLINAAGTVQFRFHFFSDGFTNNYDGWAIDNFAITAPPIPLDAGVVAILLPIDSTQTGASVNVTVRVKNLGTNNLTSIPVRYSVNGTVTSQTWNGTLIPGNTVDVPFTSPYISPGVTYDLCSFTALAGDTYWFNDSICNSYTVTPGTHDVGVSNILTPGVNLLVGHADTVTITIKNYGLNPESNFQVVFLRNGIQQAGGYYTATLQPGASDIYTFTTPNIALLGNFDLCAKTMLSSDVYTDNDKFCIYPTGTVGIGENEYDGFELLQNMPNPSNGLTSIIFYVPTREKVKFEMVDMLGQSVMSKEVNAVDGKNQIDIDAAKIPAGIYFYSVQYKEKKLTKRMVITK